VDAENIGAQILSKAGVQTHWLDAESASQADAALNCSALSDIQLFIPPYSVADCVRLAGDAVGFHPGAGPDRPLVYAFYKGIMGPRHDTIDGIKEACDGRRGYLIFTAQQAEVIRAGVARPQQPAAKHELASRVATELGQ
jgi:hypothetical protein